MADILPKITIITVVRNAADELKKTIFSVLEQDYPHIEFIIIDGNSTDGSVEVIKAHAPNIAYWISEPDRGIYDAMNKGLARSTGEWVNFMNAGDTFTGKDIISKAMAGDLDGYAVVYGDSVASYEHTRVLKRAGEPEKMITGMVFCHQAAFVRRELVRDGGFDLSFPVGADFEILFGLFSAGHRFKKLPFTVAVFDTSGMSNLKMVQSAREHFAIVKKYRKVTFPDRLYHHAFICWVGLVSLGYRVLPGWVVQRVRGRG
jgi:glycosyltransferase involved in cell wall biosynthesis